MIEMIINTETKKRMMNDIYMKIEINNLYLNFTIYHIVNNKVEKYHFTTWKDNLLHNDPTVFDTNCNNQLRIINTGEKSYFKFTFIDTDDNNNNNIQNIKGKMIQFTINNKELKKLKELTNDRKSKIFFNDKCIPKRILKIHSTMLIDLIQCRKYRKTTRDKKIFQNLIKIITQQVLENDKVAIFNDREDNTFGFSATKGNTVKVGVFQYYNEEWNIHT